MPKSISEEAPFVPLRPDQITSGRVTMMQERLIGRVVVVWAKLESLLNELIWVIQGKDIADGRTLTERMQITKLIGTLRSLIDKVLIEKGLIDEADRATKLLDGIEELKDQRNLIVHGSWGDIDGVAAVGSLRAKTDDANSVTVEFFPPRRMI